jgi:hypothetical protein
MDEVKAFESDAVSEFESEQEKGIWIIDAEPSATIATTTKVQLDKPIEPKEGEMIQMDFGGLQPIPTGSFWQFSSLVVFS